MTVSPTNRVVRLPEVESLTGYSGQHIWRLERAGLFPSRFKLNPGSGSRGAVGWLLTDIEMWIRTRAGVGHS